MNISNGRYWEKPWSLISSCTRCSEGCKNCWALAMEKRFHKGIEGVIATHPDRLDVPLKRKKPTVYATWNDMYHEGVSDEFRNRVFTTTEECPQHTFLVLTKRITVNDYIKRVDMFWDMPNVYHGLTVCNQQEADEKIPIFLQVPGKKFLSIEPMLGEINFRWMKWISREHSTGHLDILKDISCVILGGETGPGARPMHPDWVRSVRDQCKAVGVPFFLKHINKKEGRLLDGIEHNDLPWRNV